MKPRGSVFEQCAVAVLAAALAIGIAYNAIGFSQGLAVPHSGTGDAACMTAIAKGFLEQGGIYHNPWLGAPGIQELFDFPNSDLLNWMVLRGLVLFAGQPVTATHLFLLGSFALAAATAALVALRLRVLPPAALFVGVCFSLLPYHFYRGVGHLFLANYFMVPVAVLIAVRLMGPLPVRPSSADVMPYAMRSLLPPALVCVVIGMTAPVRMAGVSMDGETFVPC
ncbi:MAG: hypothetical protein EBZ74_09835 [Planctomycetia bacterium]|nr:hypothetical protein [Planctomycetia bacterium]